MKRIFLSFLILASLCASASSFQGKEDQILAQKRVKEEDIRSLAAELNLTDPDLVRATQTHWLRKPNQERWEMQKLSSDQSQIVIQWAEKVGLFHQWTPSLQTYDQAVIFGATTYSMQKRLNYLIKLWQCGIRFRQVTWLTGTRPLDPKADADLFGAVKTESDAARTIWEKTSLPEEMRNLNIVWVATPEQKQGDTFRRANTQDTLIDWLALNPTPCSSLFISNQPFCEYQYALVESVLPKGYQRDVVGPGVGSEDFSSAAAAAIILDTVARTLYVNSVKAAR